MGDIRVSELEELHDTVYIAWELTLGEALNLVALLRRYGGLNFERLTDELNELYWEALADARREAGR